MKDISPLGAMKIAILVEHWNKSLEIAKKQEVAQCIADGRFDHALTLIHWISNHYFLTCSIDADIRTVVGTCAKAMTVIGRNQFPDLNKATEQADRDVAVFFEEAICAGHIEKIPTPLFYFSLPCLHQQPQKL